MTQPVALDTLFARMADHEWALARRQRRIDTLSASTQRMLGNALEAMDPTKESLLLTVYLDSSRIDGGHMRISHEPNTHYINSVPMRVVTVRWVESDQGQALGGMKYVVGQCCLDASPLAIQCQSCLDKGAGSEIFDALV